jgi:pimeloyl-ACP methyl ester carboxylesterase
VLAYSPSADGKPDPGEIVWTWVPYEDDPAQGKDRPVLLIGRDGGALLGLMLTSRDRTTSRDRDERYVDIGTGAWDRQGRPSEVKVDRLLRIAPDDIRREGAVLARGRFEQVIAAVPDHLLD